MMRQHRSGLNPITRWKLSRLDKRLEAMQQRYVYHARNTNNTAELCQLISEIAMLSNERARYEDPEMLLAAGGEISLKEFIEEVYTIFEASNTKARETQQPRARQRVFRQGIHDLKRVLDAVAAGVEPY